MNRVQVEIALGTLLILITSSFILFYGFNEEERMADTALAQRGRSIEVGAALFEQQCSRCHDTQGQGTPAMPSFSEKYGGPLRKDQIRAIADFVMNWQETATLVELPTLPTGETVGANITKELPSGDAKAGEELSVSLACTACHIAAPTGPAWAAGAEPGIGARAETRFSQPGYSGSAKSAEQYLFESIAVPGAYLVSGFADGPMPNNYAAN